MHEDANDDDDEADDEADDDADGDEIFTVASIWWRGEKTDAKNIR